MKYYLYARKSTEEDSQQVLSIEAQIVELKEFAAKEKLEIVASFQEAKTAKEPGRTKFGEMLKGIESGEADGILAWHPDRLARNSVDGGKIIHLVDQGHIKSLKFPTFWFEPTPQGLFMLSIAFGQSKYFVDNLRENIKRGFRQKLRRGEWPGWAPPGYQNDRLKKVILVDEKTAPLVRRMFEMYVTNECTCLDLANLMYAEGLTKRSGGRLSLSTIQRILSNPFYCGLIQWNGELYPAAHKPIISKRLFDECQAVMARRGNPKSRHTAPFTFTALMKCGSCGAYITAEQQKGHVYYRCTKKKGPCEEKQYLREESLVEQVKNLYSGFALPDDWIENMLAQLEKDREKEVTESSQQILSLKEQVNVTDMKLDRLLDAHLEGVLGAAEYKTKKDQLLGQKVSLEQRIAELKRKGSFWLEPLREFLLRNKEAKNLARRGEPAELRSFLKNIGSNFLLKGRKLAYEAKIGWATAADFRSFPNWYRGPESNRRPWAYESHALTN